MAGLYIAMDKIDDSITFQKKAIKINKEYKLYAKEEKYFKSIRNLSTFLEIVGKKKE
jgi:hypothetical protein